jgi:hypothetical protein
LKNSLRVSINKLLNANIFSIKNLKYILKYAQLVVAFQCWGYHNDSVIANNVNLKPSVLRCNN